MTNDAAFVVGYYNSLARLAKLGYYSNIDDLDCTMAEALIIVSEEIDKLTDRDNGKSNNRHPSQIR